MSCPQNTSLYQTLVDRLATEEPYAVFTYGDYLVKVVIKDYQYLVTEMSSTLESAGFELVSVVLVGPGAREFWWRRATPLLAEETAES